MPTPDGGTTFTPEVCTALQVDGIPFVMEQHDLNHDGQTDMMFTVIKPRFFKVITMIVGAVLTGSVPLDLQFYAMDGGIYADKPNTTRKTKTYPSDKTGDRTAYSSVLVGDVNGDKHSDLLVQQGPKELRVFIGVPAPNLFTRKPLKVAVTTPNKEKNIWLVDINGDEKQDILIYHPSTTMSHRVILLIAQ